MSDMFDHCFDAHMDLWNREGDCFGCNSNIGYDKDPLFYHNKVYFKSILLVSDKYKLCVFVGGENVTIRVNKKYLRKIGEDSCYIWNVAYTRALRTAVNKRKFTRR